MSKKTKVRAARPMAVKAKVGLSDPRDATATSFATLKDLEAYIRCLLGGGSETHCYNYGDNGRGAWGDLTAQLTTPMCALPPQDMVAQWGSTNAARGKKVLVMFTFGGTPRAVVCTVGDKGPSGVIDLNPAALQKADLPTDTELNVPATYYWLL